jgi:hypothetical protein
MSRMRVTGSAPPRQQAVAQRPSQAWLEQQRPNQAQRLRISAINYLRVEGSRQTAQHPDRAASIQTHVREAIAIVNNMTDQEVLTCWAPRKAT